VNRPDNVHALSHAGDAAHDALQALDLIYSTAPIGLCVLDSSLRFVRINAWLARLNGRPAEAHIGRTVREMVPGIADVIEPIAHKVLDTGEPVLDFEVRGTTAADPEHEHTWVESWYPVAGPRGAVVGLSVVVRDETEIRSVQRRIAVSEARLRTMLETTRQTFWITDPDGGNLEQNFGWCAFTGQTMAQARGEGWLDAVHPEDRPRVSSAWGEAVQTEGMYELEYRVRRADGVYVWTLARGAPIRDASGRITEWAGTTEDITERRRIREELRESEARFRRFWDSGLLGCFTWRTEGPITEANAALLAMLGYERADLEAGRLDWRKLTPHGWEEADASAVQELQTSGQCTPFEKQYLHRDGHPVDVIIGAAMFTDSPDAGIAFALDISERKRNERELAQRRRFEEQLLGIVGHDLRNPLASVLLGVAMLQRKTEDEAERRTLGRIERSTRRMQGIITGLLDVTRVRSGRGLALERRHVDLGRVTESVVEELTTTHPGRIELRTAGDLGGEWDPERLEQLLSNLVLNALQHGEAHGPVLVEVGETGDGVLLAVHNGGASIAPEQLASIFEAFQRGTNAGRVDGSVGLGLFIAEEIARAHGGRLEASSAAGRTTFRTFLPRS